MTCQCSLYHWGKPCGQEMTAEDLLCDDCRADQDLGSHRSELAAWRP